MSAAAPALTTKNSFYVDLLMKEWGISKRSRRLHDCVQSVLGEIVSESVLFLRNEPRLQVVVNSRAPFSVWAYFPMHRRRRILRVLNVTSKPETKILLALNDERIGEQDIDTTKRELRDHIGHTLLYLDNPTAWNDCGEAQRTWRAACR